jgi:glycosyltransferase involved in cell wall biosynthesis
MTMTCITVAIPTHNPHKGRLRRVLDALEAQTLPYGEWSVLLIDNASKVAVETEKLSFNLRVVREERLGLSWARLRALREAPADLIVLVDDDNVLCPTYLEEACRIAEVYPALGAFGGKSSPEWEGGITPPAWLPEFKQNLAVRDLGEVEIVESWREGEEYPGAAPIGAGMVIRKEAAAGWVKSLENGVIVADRTGSALTSGGDNDIIMHCARTGYQIGYFPQLQLTHIIPEGRLTLNYQARLNRGIAKSWVQVLALHGICPWSPIARWTVPIRSLRSYIRYRAWAGPAEYIRWSGARGYFEGRAAIREDYSLPSRL